jgi:exopolysaccharide production protein ExoZ
VTETKRDIAPLAGHLLQRELFGIQMLRGIAAILVVLHHSLEESFGSNVGPRSPDWLTTFGASGVDIFFVISGFIMLYVSFPPDGAPILPAKFLARRVARIYPLYWFFCLIFLLVVTCGFLRSAVVTPSNIVASILLLPGPDRLIGISWTLSYEIYFYLVFAGTLFFRSQRLSTLLCFATLGSAIIVSSFVPAGVIAEFLGGPIALEFCFGLLVAFLYTGREDIRISATFSIFGFIALAAAPLMLVHPSTNGLVGFSRVLAWGVPSTFIVICFLKISRPKNMMQLWMVFLGDASYSIYISHFLVMISYARLLKNTRLADFSQTSILPVVVALCVVLGAAAHLVVELPLLRLSRILLKRVRLEKAV